MSALQDSKTDHTKALDEIDALKNAYDELEAAGKKLLKDKEAEWVLRYETGVQELSKRYPSLDDANEQTRKQLAETQNELACVQRKLAEFEDAEKRNPAVPIFTNSPRSKQSLKPMAFDEQDIIQAGMSLPRISSYRTCSRSRPRTLQSTLTRSRSCSPTAMERLEQAFINSTTQVQQLREECDSLGRQKRFSEVRVKHLEDDMSRIHQQLNISDSEQTPIRPMLPVVVEARDDDDGTNYIQNVMQTDDINLLKGECQSLLKKMILQRDHNALLLSKVLSLQGNIQVCCRVRPMKSSELKGGQSRLIEPLSETEVGCFDSRTKTWRSFVFDKVWGPDSTQQGVFQDVEPLALSVVEGYNACIFAYGQTYVYLFCDRANITLLVFHYFLVFYLQWIR
jgi:kinesin family protein C2/C3